MSNKYKQSIRFRDANKNSWCVEIEIRNKKHECVDRTTLQPFTQLYEVSVCGEGCGGCGQCDTHIKPRTQGQRSLLEFWSKYHLNNMSGGTHRQSRYLQSKKYEEDYYHFIELFTRIPNEERKQYTVLMNCILTNDGFVIDKSGHKQVAAVIKDKMQGNPVRYIMGCETYDTKHDMKDYYVQCFFLALNGIYEDRGYKYGTSWLYDPLPDNIGQMIEGICNQIEKEEKEYSASLANGDADCQEPIGPTTSVDMIMHLGDFNRQQAERFIALGTHLNYSYADMMDTFTEVSEHLYSVNGCEYYVGTVQELKDLVHDTVHNDSEYEYFWKEAVAAGSTTLGLNDWLEILVDDDWCSVLNHYDGTYQSYWVDGTSICVCRT